MVQNELLNSLARATHKAFPYQLYVLKCNAYLALLFILGARRAPARPVICLKSCV